MPTTRRSDTIVFTYAVNPLNTGLDFSLITSANPLLPHILIEYYNRRCTLQLCAELYNYEIILCALDTAVLPNPVLLNDVLYPPDKIAPQPDAPRRILCSCTNPEPIIRRVVSNPTEASGLFRTGQNQVFGVLGRRVKDNYYPLVRHVTCLAYLGELIDVPLPRGRLA